MPVRLLSTTVNVEFNTRPKSLRFTKLFTKAVELFQVKNIVVRNSDNINLRTFNSAFEVRRFSIAVGRIASFALLSMAM
jgi:hypothetical protein